MQLQLPPHNSCAMTGHVYGVPPPLLAALRQLSAGNTNTMRCRGMISALEAVAVANRSTAAAVASTLSGPSAAHLTDCTRISAYMAIVIAWSLPGHSGVPTL